MLWFIPGGATLLQPPARWWQASGDLHTADLELSHLKYFHRQRVDRVVLPSDFGAWVCEQASAAGAPTG